MVGGAVHHMEMGDGQFAAIVHRGRIGNVGLVVLQPILDGALILLHLAREHSHITTVIDDIVPVMFQNLFGINILGIDHQTRGVTVQTMHHMSRTVLMGLTEIVV